MRAPELSIIIPTLNEQDSLPLLLNDLLAQKDVFFEVVVSDGGSCDNTAAVFRKFLADNSVPGEFLVGSSGRGRQLNAGAAIAHAERLLFLHADSRLPDHSQLRKALDFIAEQHPPTHQNRIAGRFSLRFDLPPEDYGFGYYFYETKAALGRTGCIHGDQGMLMHKELFSVTGPFREDLPVMEDTVLAEKVRTAGQWLLLPGEIITSPRRFQVEGLQARQTLNALMMNFLSIEWFDFFVKAPAVYQQQRHAGSLHLRPFMELIVSLLKEMSGRERLKLWYATGKYVRGQAWQIGLMLDCRKRYQTRNAILTDVGPWLKRFDRWFEPLTNHCPGNALTALLVRVWFSVQLRRD